MLRNPMWLVLAMLAGIALFAGGCAFHQPARPPPLLPCPQPRPGWTLWSPQPREKAH